MTALDFPTAPSPLSATINPYEFGVTQTGFAGGEDREIGRLGRRHSIDFNYGQVDGDCAGRFIGVRNKAKVLGAPVRLAVPQPEGIGCTLTGVTVRGASQTGRLLNVGNLPTNTGRKNWLLRSAELDNAAWTKTNATISANGFAAPDGTMTSDALVETTAVNAIHSANQTVSATGRVTYSHYASPGALGWIALVVFTTGSTYYAFFNLTTGAVGTVSAGATATIAAASATVTGAGATWKRCTVTTNGSVTTTSVQTNLATADFTDQYTGTGGRGVDLWGAQLEVAAAATAYIATTSAAVSVFPTIVKAGAALSIITASRSYLYTLTDDVVGSASADGQFALDCLLRVSPGNAVAIELLNPIVEGFLQGAQAWSVDRFAAAPVSIVTIREAK